MIWKRRRNGCAGAAELDPRDFRVPDHLARIYHLRGRRTQAETEYARSAALREHYNETTRQAVNCRHALESGTLREARPACQELFDAADPDKLVTLGMLYGQHGDYADAVAPLVRAARLDTESSEIQHNLGLTYFRLKQYALARAPLERAVNLRPDFFGSCALLGATLYALKEDEAAYRTLNHAHQLNPQDADTTTLLFNTAVLLSQKQLASKAYTDSLNSLHKASELRPGDAEVHRELARVYGFLGQKARAKIENRAAESISAH
jgi:Flp pilus assembly protein TadD